MSEIVADLKSSPQKIDEVWIENYNPKIKIPSYETPSNFAQLVLKGKTYKTSFSNANVPNKQREPNQEIEPEYSHRITFVTKGSTMGCPLILYAPSENRLYDMYNSEYIQMSKDFREMMFNLKPKNISEEPSKLSASGRVYSMSERVR